MDTHPHHRRMMPVALLSSLLLLLTLAAVTADAAGQLGARRTATLVSDAPVYLLPDASRTPLRTLAAGITLFVTRVQADWVEVIFEDPQFQRRTGWVERRLVRLSDEAAEDEAAPLEPSVQPPLSPGRQPAAARRASRSRPGVRAVGSVASERMLAAQSFEAITGSRHVRSWGGGVQGINLWHGLFAELLVERSAADGTRVFVHQGEVFPLGIPTRIRMTPVDVAGGWRLPPLGRMIPYGGAGFTLLQYVETSDFTDAGENVDERHRGFVTFGGAEVRVWRWIHARGEVRYRRVNDALGDGGVSAAFDETRLGGVSGGLKVVVGR